MLALLLVIPAATGVETQNVDREDFVRGREAEGLLCTRQGCSHGGNIASAVEIATQEYWIARLLAKS
jgi:hypothetical protein